MNLVAYAGEFVILTRRIAGSGDEWQGMTLGGDPSTIVTRPNLAHLGPLAAASNGAYLMLAYDRVVEEAGHVPRVLLDPRVFVTRKRAAR